MAEVPVQDESPGQLLEGARAGLLQVLARVSGSVNAAWGDMVRDALRNPAAYYYQYSYESTDRTLVVNGEEAPAKMLKLHFEPSAIAGLLRDAGMPIWGSNRPGVLLWIAVSDEQGRRILGEMDAGLLARSLVEQARKRGLPILFPILDLEDRSRVSTAEVWGVFLGRIEMASERYSPDVMMTARVLQEADGRWSGSWAYRAAADWTSAESSALSADWLAADMIDRMTMDLAGRYALGAARASISLVVEGVARVGDYAALSEYLAQLTPVISSSILALQGDVAEFDLRIEGRYDQLVEIIDLDQRLILLNRDQDNRRLLYRWRSGQ